MSERKWIQDGRMVYELIDTPNRKRHDPEQVNLWMAGFMDCNGFEGHAEKAAQLAAAAPELAEALQELLAAITGDDELPLTGFIQHAEAALRKAGVE